MTVTELTAVLLVNPPTGRRIKGASEIPQKVIK